MDNLKVNKYCTKRWYNKYGQLHRENGPAVEYGDGSKFWYVNGTKHREDGPAIEWPDGTKIWYKHGKRHRLDGPALEDGIDGSIEYYINGIQYSSKKEFLAKLMDEALQ